MHNAPSLTLKETLEAYRQLVLETFIVKHGKATCRECDMKWYSTPAQIRFGLSLELLDHVLSEHMKPEG